mmetsp:Transcript_19402/g.22181  ORF Transcript_19402/g.22181 Transcript_19402/m.22181 type:complete len:421 (-) Transcript_19402:57-1319(-)|eukprot:CAMPEP_0194141832 /NCGR_PEP_ID=MMETSP0152-20130528/11208_1 /TAXON_ID=1049557 /ORGANISM="Thalassiothrix antarctica, Strain L6-D1" /LENGTH=420 /DNA_ID=CAMNT_0038840589 /DNA_START=40 /DNA_END=1302 /DNA_ORIENTATION=-
MNNSSTRLSLNSMDNSSNGDNENNNAVPAAVVSIIQPQQPRDESVSTDDDNSGREYSGVFEGPEKTLEVCFRPINNNSDNKNVLGLRQLQRRDLDRLCGRACCTILSSISNDSLDAYVLSESSLFIYPNMLVLKTCGTTTLLRVISVLIEMARRSCNLEIDWVGYSRKNFSFPGDQAFPHQSFHQELEYLYSHRNLCERLHGNGYTLGPVTADHWFVFVADHAALRAEGDTDRVLNIMMFDVDPSISQSFYYENYSSTADESKEDEIRRISSEMTEKSGISDLFCSFEDNTNKFLMDTRAFEPCGYSMNAIRGASYSTIHITPESGSSYASFETNQKVASYSKLIHSVLTTFQPKRFVMTLMADELGLQQMTEQNPLEAYSSIGIPTTTDESSISFKRSSLASIKVEDDCCCMMGNWNRV